MAANAIASGSIRLQPLFFVSFSRQPTAASLGMPADRIRRTALYSVICHKIFVWL